jgi:hypothetical protein
MECEPGLEAQVDFGRGAWVINEAGQRRRPHLLRVILGHSRKGYSEALWRQTSTQSARLMTSRWCSINRTVWPGLDQALEAIGQALDAGEMRTGGRLMENVEVVSSAAPLPSSAASFPFLRQKHRAGPSSTKSVAGFTKRWNAKGTE